VERRLRYPYWKFRHDPGAGVVHIARTPEPFSSLEELGASISELAFALDLVGRSSMVLLVDLRPGPMRTDAAFEDAMARARAVLLRGIPKVAVIVATPLGRMQVSRHQRRDGAPWCVFNDEKEACAYLGLREASVG
jgi:hypothetical protein